MPTTTPMGVRMNQAYDELRIVLSRMHPDKAEQCRSEVIVLLTAMRLELLNWVGTKKSRLPIMPEGSVLRAMDIDESKVEELTRLYGDKEIVIQYGGNA